MHKILKLNLFNFFFNGTNETIIVLNIKYFLDLIKYLYKNF